MKSYFLSTAALLLPGASHAFLAASRHGSQTRLFQQYYGDDQGGQYYGGGDDGQQQYDEQQGQDQQYYDQQGQDQQQYYDQGQQQEQQYSDQGEQQGGAGAEEPSLLITGNMQEEMRAATSGVELGGIDYLALARQRAAQRVESNNESSDADWVDFAEEKKREMGDMAQYSEDDDWENSLNDEGSESDNIALGMGVVLEEADGGVMMTEGGLVVDNVGEEGGDGPQLLL